MWPEASPDWAASAGETVSEVYAVWDPKNPHLFTDRPLGIGWSINLARLHSVLKS